VRPAYTVCPEVAELLGLDAIGIQILPPLFVDAAVRNGRAEIRDGLLTTQDDLKRVILPDPDDAHLYRRLESMISEVKGDRAIYARIRLGGSSTLLSIGMEGFSYALADDPDFIDGTLRMFSRWSQRVSENLSELDFDFFWSFDDIAFKSGPMFSMETLEKHFLPHMKHAASGIRKPWIFHSDGNILPILPRLMSLGMNGIHPLEPGTMDLKVLKCQFGKSLCLVGNIDIDKTLTRGTVEDVYREVEERICALGPGGGYIISDSNSVPSYCEPKNIIAMAEAVRKYKYIYLGICFNQVTTICCVSSSCQLSHPS